MYGIFRVNVEAAKWMWYNKRGTIFILTANSSINRSMKLLWRANSCRPLILFNDKKRESTQRAGTGTVVPFMPLAAFRCVTDTV